jgi:hypothetical protein
MQDANRQSNQEPARKAAEFGRPATSSQCIDWYSEGESRTVEVDGVRVEVRYVGRKGRRGRIAITAPPGSSFRDSSAIKRQ